MRYLIVSYSCAPLNIISAQRINSLALYLARHGHSVDILTAVKRPIDGPIDAIGQLERLVASVNVHEVEFLGRKGRRRADGSAPPSQGAMRGFARDQLKRCRAAASSLFGALFDYRTIWALRAVAYFRKNLAGNNYDVLVTSSGPACVNYIGFRIKRISPSIKWVADFRDLWSLLHSSKVTSATRRAEMSLEKALLRRADKITTVSSHLADQLASLHGLPVQVVRNGFDPFEFANVPADRVFFVSHGCAERINIVYAGSIYDDRRSPLPLIRAIANSALRGRIAVHFFGFNLGNVPAMIRREDASDFCHVHESRPREAILGIQKAADINLLLESGADDARGVLTGKLFELAALGRPILSIGPPRHFESMRILERTGLHLHWETLGGDIVEVAERYRDLCPDPSFIRTLSRDFQFNHVSEFSGNPRDD